jgi:hypothetical protein
VYLPFNSKGTGWDNSVERVEFQDYSEWNFMIKSRVERRGSINSVLSVMVFFFSFFGGAVFLIFNAKQGIFSNDGFGGIDWSVALSNAFTILCLLFISLLASVTAKRIFEWIDCQFERLGDFLG